MVLASLKRSILDLKSLDEKPLLSDFRHKVMETASNSAFQSSKIVQATQNKKRNWNQMRETDRLGMIVLVAVLFHRHIRKFFQCQVTQAMAMGEGQYHQTKGW